MNYKNEQGSIQVAGLILAPIFLTLFFGSAYLSLLSQEKIALWYRLDVCAARVIALRQRLLVRIQQSNQIMTALQNIVYLARGAKAVPVAGWAAAMGEKAALLGLHNVKNSQNLLWQTIRMKEIPLRVCSPDRFSEKISWCQFSSLPHPERRPTLFADVPGTLILTQAKRLQVSCGSQASWPKTTLVLTEKEYRYLR